MKPIVATLRKLSIRLILYLDDMLVMAPMKEEVRKHLATALKLLIALGFMINMKKSVTHPAQVMEFLGFVLNSNKMFHFPTESEVEIPTEDSKQAQVLGMMVAAYPAILLAP